MNELIRKLADDKTLTELLSGSGLVMIFKLVGMLSGYVLSLAITKLIGVESYGVYSICFTILHIAVVLAKMGLDNAQVKSISAYMQTHDQPSALLYFRKSFLVVVISSTIIAFLLFALSDVLSEVFENQLLVSGLKITSLIVIPNALLHIQAEKMRGLKKMAWYSFLYNGSIALFAAGILFVIAQQFKPVTDLALWALGGSISLLMVFMLFKRDLKTIQANWNSIPFAQMFKLSLPMLLSGSMFLVMSWTDILLLGYFLDETQVAIYSIAFKISAIVAIALYAINAIASPQFSELFSSNQLEKLKKLSIQIANLNFILTVPIMLVIVMLPEFILGIFGEEFINGKTALFLLCAGQFFSSICGSVLTLLNMAGREKTVSTIVGSTAFLNFVLNWFFIQKWGIEGAALATFISLIIWNLWGLLAVKKNFGFIMLPRLSK